MIFSMAIPVARTVTISRHVTGKDHSVSRICELDIDIGIAMGGSAAWTMTALSCAVATVADVAGKTAVAATVFTSDIRE